MAWGLMNYKPNKWALEHIHQSTARFNAITTCRQCGKTETASMQIFDEMLEPADEWGRPPSVGVLSSDFAHAELSIDRLIHKLRETYGEDFYKQNRNSHKMFWPSTGAELIWLSSDDEYSVVGQTFSALIIDEAQSVPDKVWNKIRPTLDVRNARCYAFGTPDFTKDQSWFRAMFLRGQDEQETDYHSFKLSCYENPWMDLETIEDAKKTLTEREFKMLYLGEWVDDEGSVFREVDSAIDSGSYEYNPKHRVVMALDPAATDDYNVVMVGEMARRRVIEMDRWNKAGTIQTIERVISMWERYGKPKIFNDSSNMGGIIMADLLRERGATVVGVGINAQTKIPLIQRLASDIEHRRIMFPDFPQLIRELKAYQYEATPSGKLTANAPAGFHDDTVSCLVLLNEAMRRGGKMQKQYSYMTTAAERLRDNILIG